MTQGKGKRDEKLIEELYEKLYWYTYEASEEEGRGIYAARPYRIQGILLLLAGVADLVDDQYTRGKWE